MSHTAETAIVDLKLPQHGKMFSYLPMSHIAERIGVEIVGIYLGATLSFAESLDVFAKNLSDTQPNIFFAVPRIWAKFQEKILEKLPQKKLSTLLSIPIVKSIIKKSIRKKLGLGEATHLYTGAAPMPLSLLLWFDKIGIEIFQAYAMTENTCFGTFNRHGANKYGTVGQPLFTVEIKIGDNDEILIRHKAMLRAYYKEEGLTRDAFTDDGFFKTGDQGSVDKNNFLTITGRVKDLFKTDRGKYVAPSPIEVRLMEDTDIEHACVVGVGLPQPIALIILSYSAKEKSKEAITKNFTELVNSVNERLNSYERIGKIIIMKNDWTIENGLMTPTLKIKRNEIEKINQSFYQTWYASKEIIVWEQ
jgi:long-chain acyl-CoA synthetase